MGALGYKAPDARRAGFPILRTSAEEVVMGLDDAHLDFRARIRVSAVTATSSRITPATAVVTHNWRGAVLPGGDPAVSPDDRARHAAADGGTGVGILTRQ